MLALISDLQCRPETEIGSILVKIRSRISLHETLSRVACTPKRSAFAASWARSAGVDEHLGGDAADVQAGAAEHAVLQQGDAPVGESFCRPRSYPSRSRSTARSKWVTHPWCRTGRRRGRTVTRSRVNEETAPGELSADSTGAIDVTPPVNTDDSTPAPRRGDRLRLRRPASAARPCDGPTST